MNQPPGLDIRPARPEDLPALTELSPRLTIGVAPWRSPEKVAGAVRGWIESSLAQAQHDGHAVMVAVLDDQIAGIVSVAEHKHWTGDRDAYIGELITHSAIEGRGVGRALLAAAEKWAAGRGLSMITLETGAGNHRARRFYKEAGYQDEDIRLAKRVDDGQQHART